jgi:hypothetical protein
VFKAGGGPSGARRAEKYHVTGFVDEPQRAQPSNLPLVDTRSFVYPLEGWPGSPFQRIFGAPPTSLKLVKVKRRFG